MVFHLMFKIAKSKGGIKDYFVKVLNGMALGLFSSLLIGLITKQLGTLFGIQALITFGSIAQKLMGSAIGAGVAYSVGAPPLGIFASVVTGAIGAGSITFDGATAIINIGEPVGAFVASLVGAEFSKLISGKTKVDIVLVPLATIIIGGLVGQYIGPYMTMVMDFFGNIINKATEMHPIPMGDRKSVV